MVKGFVLVASGLAVLAGVLGVYDATRPKVVALRVDREAYLQKVATDSQSAADHRIWAEEAVRVGNYEDARKAYALGAEILFKKGDDNMAFQYRRWSQRYETWLRAFVPDEKPPQRPLAKHEPANGLISGAFIDNEAQITETYAEANGKVRRDLGVFNRWTGIQHQMAFIYLRYDQPFPVEFVRDCKENGAMPQIAWEPKYLEKVQDDKWLRSFARACGQAGVPIFLRFASEMNGDWVRYSGDPKLYIEKWRLVTRVMREEAPNVAMVWCVFEIPERHIEDYYPGAEYVDWVGVNVYSVPFYDNDPKRDGSWRHPLDGVRHVDELYGKRHPILICEYASSHMSSLDRKFRNDFAIERLREMYYGLPLIYPGVKGICWLSMDATKWAIEGRQKNNYSVLDQPSITLAYRQALQEPWMLVGDRTPADAVRFRELKPGEDPAGRTVRIHVKQPREAGYRLFWVHRRGETELSLRGGTVGIRPQQGDELELRSDDRTVVARHSFSK